MAKLKITPVKSISGTSRKKLSEFDRLRNAVISKGYVFFEQGDYNLNFIWERMDNNITNRFTDFLHILYYLGGKPQIITIPATTKPGLHGAIDKPVTYDGVTGTAVIIPGQYRSAWKFIDSYSEWLNYPYFRQVKFINYWRDGDKDLVIDLPGIDDSDPYLVAEQDSKLFGTHWHRMSNVGTYGSGEVNNWSLGCMGAPEPEWKKILPVTREAVKRWGSLFTGTLIERQ